MSAAFALAGRLRLRPGHDPAVRCERPMVAAAMMRRLAEGQPARRLPGLLGSVFSLGAAAQALTARRAVHAALGLREDAAGQAADARTLRQAMLAEHLQRLALDLPGAGDPSWLRGAPAALPATDVDLATAESAWPAWLSQRLFGRPAADWLRDWRARTGDALADWADACAHPVARAFAALQPRARMLAWPARPLPTDEAPGTATAAALADALRRDDGFAERPTWAGLPAETGAWWRQGDATRTAPSAWDRLGARLADVAALACGEWPASGALPLTSREGIAWCQMSRGLLVHWARVDRGAGDADGARIEAYRLLAPTEWNFHPDGAFAHWLRDAAPMAGDARLAALSLDPCLAVEVGDTAPEVGHA